MNDIFVAYHGDSQTGSKQIADRVVELLEQLTKDDGSKLSIFYQPQNSNRPFGDTPRQVQNSKVFLFVANENVPTNSIGQLEQNDKNGIRRRIYDEVKAFSESISYRTSNNSVSRVITCGSLSFESAEKLDPIFNGTEHIEFNENFLNNITRILSSLLNTEIKCSLLDNKNAQLYGLGSIVSFGKFYSSNNELSDIKWKVCTDVCDKALLVSQYIIISQPYNNELINCTWETSYIRKWLNTEFYESAFSAKEREQIIKTKIHTPNNPKYETWGGNDSFDKVFLLDINEVQYYFRNDKERQKQPTQFAKENGAFYNHDNGNGYWWLRSPGYHASGASGVDDYGYISRSGNGVIDASNGCVPAIWVKK